MGKFDSYKVDLRNLSIGTHTFTFKLDNKFFGDIDGLEFQKGTVQAVCTVKSTEDAHEMQFHLEGTIMVLCDRCLDDMELPIDVNSRLVVKLGEEYVEESEEIVVIPEHEGIINLAWFLYEFIALSIPLKHIHPPGKCNKMMSSKLRKHIARSADDEEDEMDDDDSLVDISDEDDQGDSVEIDPRWDALKNLK